MKKAELFEGIFDFSKRLQEEYAEYLDYCGRKKGLVYAKPKDKLEKKIELMLYGLKRNMIINKTTIGTMLSLAEKGGLPPPEQPQAKAKKQR